MGFQDKNWYKVIAFILTSGGTLLVTLNIIDADVSEALQGLLPALTGVVMQVIGILQSLGIINLQAAKVVKLSTDVAALKAESSALKAQLKKAS